MNDAQTFGRRLRRLRTQRRLSRREAAELTGLAAVSWEQWEGGHYRPTFDALVTLAGFFDLSLDALMRPERGLAKRSDFGPAPRSVLGTTLLCHALART